MTDSQPERERGEREERERRVVFTTDPPLQHERRVAEVSEGAAGQTHVQHAR